MNYPHGGFFFEKNELTQLKESCLSSKSALFLQLEFSSEQS